MSEKRIHKTYSNFKPSTGHLNNSSNMKHPYVDPYGNSARSKIQAAYAKNANWYNQNTEGYTRVNNLEQTKIEQKGNSLIGISGSLEQLKNQISNFKVSDYIYESSGVSSISTTSLTRDLNKIFDDLYRAWGKAVSENLKKELVPILMNLTDEMKTKANEALNEINIIKTRKTIDLSQKESTFTQLDTRATGNKHNRLIPQLSELKARKSIIESSLKEIRSLDEDDPNYENMRRAAQRLFRDLTRVNQEIAETENEIQTVNKALSSTQSRLTDGKQINTKLNVNADDAIRALQSFIKKINTFIIQLKRNKATEQLIKSVVSGDLKE